VPEDDVPTEVTGSAVVTVALVGDYDLARERELVEQVMALDLMPSSEVRLDMRAVSFVDYSGLRGLLAAQPTWRAEGVGCGFCDRAVNCRGSSTSRRSGRF
jgi:anti-anti-sigma regulatory factor